MVVITGFQRTGQPSYDGNRVNRKAADRYTATDISFNESEPELMEFAWDAVPHVFDKYMLDNDNKLAYVVDIGYHFQASHTIHRKFTSNSDSDLTRGFVGASGNEYLDAPEYTYHIYGGATGTTYGPFTETMEWAVDDSFLKRDIETDDYSTMVVKYRAVSPIIYESGLERYTLPHIDDIEEMYRG